MRPYISYLSLLLFLFITTCKNPDSHNSKDHLYEFASYKIGTAIQPELFNTDSAYRKIALEEFNSFTCMNCMKFDGVSMSIGVYDWTTADDFVNMALAKGKRVHGHTLVWYDHLPAWVQKYSGTRAQWDTLMKNHIYTEVGRYKGKVESWDVVNEAFKFAGTVLDSTIWLTNIGTGYVAKAFQYAAQADPGAKLFLNECSMEFVKGKVDSVLHLCDDLRSQGIRIDGIGVQMHLIDMLLDTNRIKEVFQKISAHNYLVHVSELDYTMDFQGNNPVYTPALGRKQERIYNMVTRAYSDIVPHQLRYGITVWGFDDSNSWIPPHIHHPDWPCLYDSTYSKKRAYYGFRDGLK